jgi:2-aminoethylphosphonate-pyruvate transaminase
MIKPSHGWKDKALFTPGPLTTSMTVKQAMLRDLGSRDTEFIEIVKEIRNKLVELCANLDEFTSILIPGSGTYGIEATLTSVIPPDGKLLLIINGAYGMRMLKIAEIYNISRVKLISVENTQPNAQMVEMLLTEDPTITHVAVVHCETTTGIINPIQEYGKIARKHHCIFIVDAMSSFGAYPIDMKECEIDFLVSSSNKCIEGTPGFSFVIANKNTLKGTAGFARTLSLDLFAQWEGLEGNGQFRFTPPTHSILAFYQALLELEMEGGITGRSERYQTNYQITINEMVKMGFKPYVEESKRGYIITSFYYPDHPNFNFTEFYQLLSEKGHVIYPGKLSHADCFRLGHIGRITSADVRSLMLSISETLKELNIYSLEKEES